MIFSKLFPNLYQRKRKLNRIFTKELVANTNSKWAFSYKGFKNFKPGPKVAIFAYFRHVSRIEFAKTMIIFLIKIPKFIKYKVSIVQRFRIVQKANFYQKQKKTLNVRTKTPYLSILSWNLRKLLSYFQPVPAKCKVLCKNKYP